MTQPCDLSAVEARRLIGLKQLSPVELLDSCLARIEAVDDKLNAMVTLGAEPARAAAAEAEARVMDGDDLDLLQIYGGCSKSCTTSCTRSCTTRCAATCTAGSQRAH